MNSITLDKTPIQGCFAGFFCEYYLAIKNEKDFIKVGQGNGAFGGEEIQAIDGNRCRCELFAKHR